MDKILDLDLDYFVWPIAHWRGPDHGRPSMDDFEYVASEEDLCRFLEEQCSLSHNVGLPGAEVVEHVEAFWTWDRWVREEIVTNLGSNAFKRRS
jgi:hypothetical protein